jgi:hypothetical protein
MLPLRKPPTEILRHFLAAQSKLDFTYPAVGSTAAGLPAGYVVDRTPIKLGGGARTFSVASCRRAVAHCSGYNFWHNRDFQEVTAAEGGGGVWQGISGPAMAWSTGS